MEREILAVNNLKIGEKEEKVPEDFSIYKHLSYLNFFNLSSSPFSLVPDSLFCFPSRSTLQILDVLKFSIVEGGLISVIIGVPGVGKTQTLLSFLKKLPSDDYTIIEIYNPAISPLDLLKRICLDLNVELKPEHLNKDLILKNLKQTLLESKSVNKKVILVIDEAQLLPNDTLEELRLLTNLNEGITPVLQILLIGQTSLRKRFMEEQFLPLRQRISVFEELKPLEKDEILPYIWFRIKQVSEHPEITLNQNIQKALYKLTKGIARLINKVMDRTLLIAYYKQERTITKKHLKLARQTFEDVVF